MQRSLGGLLAFLAVLFFSIPALAQVEVRELETRPGITVRFIYARAPNAVAGAVLFQGGGGNIGLFSNGTMRNTGFLATAAQRFNDNGITVAIPDVPSDRRDLDNFRDSQEHAQDNAALIGFLRRETGLPVWAIGTSNGSLSATASAVLLQDKGPDGLVLTSSVTDAPKPALHLVSAVPLGGIKQPVLLVHHKQDGCKFCPFDAMPALLAEFKSAKKVELISAEGGHAEAGGNPCHGGYHQFLGIEAAVTRDIADWIKRAMPL
jgi:hypothetical protein